MGSCLSIYNETQPPTGQHERMRSKEIDRHLKEDAIKIQKETEIKILLLGAGESGKTTVLKQMQIIHERGGLTAFQRDHYHRQVFTNLCEGMRLCLEFMDQEEIQLDDKSLEDSLPLFRSTPYLEPGTAYPKHYLEPLQRLWRDSGTRLAMSRGNEWAMPENMNYFYPDLDRVFKKSYTPTDQDILYCRGQTVGITEMSFQVAGLKYRGYDSTLLEERDANQVQEALSLFDSIVHVPFLAKSSIILFLNKTDLFKKKLQDSPISKYFPDFEGDNQDLLACQSYFQQRFLSLNRSKTRPIYTHFTCATDSSAMKSVMAGVSDTIIRKNFEGFS